MRVFWLIAAVVLFAGCTSTRLREPSPLAPVTQFYAAPVEFAFEPPAQWELPEGEWAEKTGHFSDAWTGRLAVTRRLPIEHLPQGPLPLDSAVIRLVIHRVDRGFFAYVARRPAICEGELIITGADGRELEVYRVKFMTPDDAGYQWYTYGGRLESAFDDFGVETIDIIQRSRRR